MSNRRKLRSLLITGVSLFSLAAAHAQTQPAPLGEQAAQGGLQEIVVTAEKRAESVQDTPLAITALNGADLQLRQVTSLEDLAPSLPSVNFGTNVGFARIAIRGLGLDATVGGNEGRVAYHTDGIYISRPSAQMSSFFDVNRVEVLSGPQGTLYGRNATAGAVNVITNDPESTFGGYINATVGNYDLVREEGAMTGALSDDVSARLAFTDTNRGGYGKDLTTGQGIDDDHSGAVRGKILVTPTDSVKIMLSADYAAEDDAAFVYHYLGQGNPLSPARAILLGGSVPSDPRDTYDNVPQSDKRKFWGFGSTVTADLGSGINLTSVTGYRNSYADVIGDHDGTQANLSTIQTLEKSETFSQEVRLDGEIDALRWMIGGFYFAEDGYAESDFSPVLAFSNSFLSRGLHFNGDFGTRAEAGFGQMNYEVVDGLTLTAGVRYSHELKTIDQRGSNELTIAATPSYAPRYTSVQDGSASFSSTTPNFNVEWKPTRNLMLYATYSEGFKSGGFNLASFTPAVQPEKLKDYEGGIKSDWFDHTLRVNASVFHYDYTNLQVQQVLNASAVLVNAAAAEVNGVEGQFVVRPVERIEISGDAAFLDATFTDFHSQDSARLYLGTLNLAGNQLPQAPKYTANLSAQYTLPVPAGQVKFRGELAYTSLVYFSFFNRPEVSQPGYAKENASITYQGESGLTASLWIKNIADKRTISTAQVSSGFIGYPIMGTYDPPRTFGATVGYAF